MQSGKVYAIESMGLVDGPGIRVVVFFQGCPLSCKFCHNPDSQSFDGGRVMTTKEIIDKIVRFRPYFERSGGGVTFSGGEPLLQKDFLIELLQECKKLGIHTCLDTSGVGIGGYDEILSLTDLVLYDVKATDERSYEQICGLKSMSETNLFQIALAKSKVQTIVRQVVIPGINDTDKYMRQLKNYIKDNIPTAIKVELLAYHKLGSYKYANIGKMDPLYSIPAMDPVKTNELWEKYFRHI